MEKMFYFLIKQNKPVKHRFLKLDDSFSLKFLQFWYSIHSVSMYSDIICIYRHYACMSLYTYI